MFEPDVPVTVDERHFALEPDDVAYDRTDDRA